MTPVYLLTALGTAPYKDSDYCLGTETFRTPFAPLAALKLCRLDVIETLVLCTPSAGRQAYPQMAEAFGDAGVGIRSLDIPEPAPDHVFAIFDAIVDAVPQSAHLWLDVTYGFRSFAMVALAAITYLRGLRNVMLLGCTYGAHEAKGIDGAVPIAELGSIIDLLEWFSALTAVRESGSLRPLARMTSSRLVGALRQAGPFRNQMSVVNKQLEKAAEGLAARLPIEFGIDAEGLMKQLREVVSEAWPDRALGQAMREVFATFEPLALPTRERNWSKGEVQLNSDEVSRQLAFAEHLLNVGDIGGSAMVLRETIVNLQLHVSGVDLTGWFDKDQRDYAERTLAQRVNRVKHARDKDDRRWLRAGDEHFSRIWSRCSNLRNQYAHAGMRPDLVKPAADKMQLREIIDAVRCFERPPTECSDSLEKRKRPILITSLGKSSGLLYTVLCRIEPSVLICVTSPQGRRGGEEALQLAQQRPIAPVQTIWIEIADPYSGFEEVQARISWPEIRAALSATEALDIVLNRTGGTSVLQYCAEKVTAELAQLGFDLHQIAAVDRRSELEQQQDPFVIGEIVSLDIAADASKS